MTEDGGEPSNNREVKLGIYDRLKKVPAFSQKSQRVLTNPRGKQMDSMEKAAETAARRIVEDLFKQENDAPDPMADFVSIETNDYLTKESKEQEDNIFVCICVPEENNPEAACGTQKCLNVIKLTECSSTSCPCKEQCKNQRFTKRQYAKTRLMRTDNKGWGLATLEDLKAGDFVIEYCGDVIPNKDANARAKAYKLSELKDSYMIPFTPTKFIDATRKGNMARFINHSCEPNCEPRRWTVRGQNRIGMFAVVDVNAGTELTYDYHKSNWHDGGLKVRCACGAKSCVGTLGGGNSMMRQRDAYEWDDDARRGEIEEAPNSTDEDDAPLSSFMKGLVPKKLKGVSKAKGSGLVSKVPVVEINMSTPPAPLTIKETNLLKDPLQSLSSEIDKESQVARTSESGPFNKRQRTAMTRKRDTTPKIAALVGKLKETPPNSRLRGIVLPTKPNSLEEEEIKVAKKRARSDAEAQGAERIASTEQMLSANLSRVAGFQRARTVVNKQLAEEQSGCFPVSEAACTEVEFAQGMEAVAASDFRQVCDDIQPAVKEAQNLGQEVPAEVSQKWMEARCKRLRSTIDFHFSIIRHLAGPTFALSQARDAAG